MAKFPIVGRIHRSDSALDELIAPEAEIEQLEVGLAWSEGPVWDSRNGCLLFSDIPRNAIIKWSEADGASIWMQPSGYTGIAYYGKEPGSNGLTFDSEGRLYTCEHGDRRVSRLEHSGGKKTIVDSFQGKRLNSPNDLALHSDGSLYFTDPAYGLHHRYDDPDRELDFCGVYLVKPGASEPILLVDDLLNPNGVAFTPDEKQLYVTQSNPQAALVMKYPVNADGTLGAGRVFKDVTEHAGPNLGNPDGIKVDRSGNVFTTGPGGVWILNPGGEVLGRIDTGERIANLAWGDGGSTLYLCSHGLLCRVRTLTSGPLPGSE